MSSQPQCPKCAAQLNGEYGMVECPSCGIFVFVDMDGIGHISGDADASDNPLLGNPADISPDVSSDISPDISPDILVEPSADLSMDRPVDQMMEPPDFLPPLVQEEEVAALGSVDDHSGDLDMDALLGFNQTAPEPVAEEFGAPGDPLGLNEYANSEISQAKDGLLTFKILISGIDSKEMRESLRSALDDQRFGWNPNALISRISKGALLIENVASVKAVILINRIKRMSLKVRWEQYAITNMESH